HDGKTVAHAVSEIKRFIAENSVQGVNLRLASGNVGVMAATNEAVSAAEVGMLLAIFGALALLCLLTFRSFKAMLCVLVPLTVVSIFCNALMATLGIGLKVATLPVIALGVGIGVDYGIYIYSRLESFLRAGLTLQEAYYQTLKSTGKAVLFTGLCLAIGVATWIFSAIKFQADMGLMLTFMFIVNMFGALWLLPALARFLIKPEKLAGKVGNSLFAH
ncbi:MMPL family transporter, partial [Pseudomonas sp.]|uniref:MMPL family transporter n=1 Tax=Pseudomonas sp. TaxID=306 RepID=UPI002735114E